MSLELVLLLTGALIAGYVNGLAGFGTSLFSLGFWLQVYPPIEAVAMALAVSLTTSLPGLWVVRREIAQGTARLRRFLVPALLGVPAGVASLALISPTGLKLVIGAMMMLYGLFFILRGSLPQFERPTPWIDRLVGLVGGYLGGLAGLAGALPVMWFTLRPWPRRETRAVLQPFNFAILAITMSILVARGSYTGPVLLSLSMAIPVALLAAQAGLWTFKRIGDTQFRWTLIALMLVAGAAILARELF